MKEDYKLYFEAVELLRLYVKHESARIDALPYHEWIKAIEAYYKNLDILQGEVNAAWSVIERRIKAEMKKERI